MFAANSCISSVTIHVRKVLPLFVGLGERACGSARFSAGSDQKKHELDENVVLWIQARNRLWRFIVEGQPFLHALHASALCKIEKQREIQNNRRRQNRIAAKEVDLDLHWITEPAENIDIVPAFLIVAARRVVVNANHMRKILVELWIDFWLKNVFEH